MARRGVPGRFEPWVNWQFARYRRPGSNSVRYYLNATNAAVISLTALNPVL